MNNLEAFMKDTASYAGLFTFPVCGDLEGNYQRLFIASVRNQFGVYTTGDVDTVAEMREVEVVGFSAWVRGGPYEMRQKAIIKNPRRIPEKTAEFGVTNAILLDRDSDIVFAGKYNADRITIVRPVIPAYQEIFNAKLQEAVSKSILIAS